MAATVEVLHNVQEPAPRKVASHAGNKPRTLFRPIEEICDRYLRITPLSLALFRYAELQHLGDIKVQSPVVDLGCGTGLFAKAALDAPLDIGLDKSPQAIRRSANPAWYRQVLCADARSMPLESNSVGTVISISVLEHIEDIDSVIQEVHRVLIPGGSFVATVILDEIHRSLFYSGMLRRLRLRCLATLYERFHDRVFRHVTLLPAEDCCKKLVSAGFRLDVCKRVISPTVTCCFDALLATAWPYRVLTAFGVPAIPRPAWWRRFWSRRFKALIEKGTDDGICLFFIARKSERPCKKSCVS